MRACALVLLASMAFAACGSDGNDATEGTAGAATSAPTTISATTSSTRAIGPEVPAWAVPIVGYVDALFAAANRGGVADLFPFFGENATLWADTSRAKIRRAGDSQDLLTRLESITTGETPTRDESIVFATWIPPEVGPRWHGSQFDRPGFWALALHNADYGPQSACPDLPCRQVEMVSIAGRGDVISEFLRSTLIGDIRRDPRIKPSDAAAIAPLLDEVEADYFELAAAITAQDVGRVLGTAGGREPDPGDVAAVAAMTSALPELFALWPDGRWETLTLSDVGLRDSEDPVVFFITDSDPEDSQRELGGFGVYRLDLEPGVSLVAAVNWLRRSEVLVALDVVLDIRSPAGPYEITQPRPAAEDWPQIPQTGRVRTGTISTDDGDAIELYNAEPVQRDLVEWAIARYEAAGLGAPTPRSIGFPPDVRCASVAGQAVHTGDGIDLLLCVEAADVCAGDGCAPSAVSRSTLLHELGHVWTQQHTDDATRQQFMEFRRLTIWSDAVTERDLLGTEHAAEVLSWGLMDEASWAARLPDSDCAVLAAGFEILTGHAPRRECAAG